MINGKGWRSGAKIIKKKSKQWFLKITKYADELLNELEQLTNCPDKVKQMQKNWINKSRGVIVTLKLIGFDRSITAFLLNEFKNLGYLIE